jgi:hypothetical protein
MTYGPKKNRHRMLKTLAKVSPDVFVRVRQKTDDLATEFGLPRRVLGLIALYTYLPGDDGLIADLFKPSPEGEAR